MKIVSLAAAGILALAAVLYAGSASAQVSTQNPGASPTYTCTAKNARNKEFTRKSSKLGKAKQQALAACRNDPFFKGCRITGCIG